MPRIRSVLIVEDEPLIAMMLEDFVETLGHRVAGAADSVAGALERIGAGGFDLAILDVNLRGGEPSWPVADALADLGVSYVFSTGGAAEQAPERHRAAPTLPKPYTMAGIEEAIARAP